MKQIKTSDGEITFFNEEFQEHYHSTTGAKEEAVRKFVKPSNLEKIAKCGKITILDICFGIGYNTAAALDLIWEFNPNCKVTVYALELDPEIILQIDKICPTFKSYNLLKESFHKKSELLDLHLILGNAIETIKILDLKANAVFLDPFSPKRCPELWTISFFTAIRRLMKTTGTLTTYSCARIVRDNLKDAGFKVEDGPCVERRGPSTIARPIS